MIGSVLNTVAGDRAKSYLSDQHRFILPTQFPDDRRHPKLCDQILVLWMMITCHLNDSQEIELGNRLRFLRQAFADLSEKVGPNQSNSQGR
jgi:hypothetical protein